MYLFVKFTDWNDQPEPLFPTTGQKVASCENSELPSLGCRNSWKFWCRRKLPDALADSNEMHELLARPARTIQVASALSVAELLDVTAAMTTLVSAASCWR